MHERTYRQQKLPNQPTRLAQIGPAISASLARDNRGPWQKGFTLVEVLVAMAILGTVVISMMALMTSQARTLSDIEEKVFAGIVAENVLAQTMAVRQAPNISVTSGEEELAGRDWAWTQNVTRHEELPLLQITVVVTRAEQIQTLATLTALRGSE